MSIELKYSMRVNKMYPIVEVVCELSKPRNEQITEQKLLQAVLIAFDMVEDCNGRLLERPFKPEMKKNGNYVWFAVGFKSFEDVADFMKRMNYLGFFFILYG